MAYIQTIIITIIISTTYTKTLSLHRQTTMLQQTGCVTDGPPNNSSLIMMGNCYNNIYTINLNIGTPPQNFTFQFDTGSNILWIPTLQYLNIGFNSSNSITFTTTANSNSIQYAGGSSVKGYQGTDVVGVTQTNISSVCPILWVYQQTNGIQPSPIIGIVGMGYSSIPNFLDNAYSSNQIKSPIFSLQLYNSTNQSMLHYDIIPEQIWNSSIFINVYGNNYWSAELIGLYVNNVDMTSVASGSVVIDSGTSYIIFNQQLYDQVVSQYFTDCNYTNTNTPHCKCSSISSWPTFSFMLPGVELYLHPQNYSRPLYDGLCSYEINAISGNSLIILGDVFFREYIITFDKINSQIGFMGQSTSIQVIGTKNNYFLITQYVMLGLMMLILVMGTVLLVIIRDKEKKNKKNKKDLNLYLLQL